MNKSINWNLIYPILLPAPFVIYMYIFFFISHVINDFSFSSLLIFLLLILALILFPGTLFTYQLYKIPLFFIFYENKFEFYFLIQNKKFFLYAKDIDEVLIRDKRNTVIMKNINKALYFEFKGISKKNIRDIIEFLDRNRIEYKIIR